MERRRTGSGVGGPPLGPAATAAEALQLCVSLRAAAAVTPTCRRDCRTLSRFVGKVMLILEALAPAVAAHAAEAAAPPRADQMGKPRSSGSLAVAWSVAVIQSRQHVAAAAAAHASAAARGTVQQAAPQAAPPQVMSPSSVEAVAVAQQLAPEALAAAWAEAAGDLREALAAAAELVAACGGMGRLQAVLEAEELRDKFAAAAGDLGLALSGLQPLQAVAPPDVAEDVAAVQRQLDVLRFCSSAAQEQLAAQLLQAVVLHHLRRCEGSAAVAPLLMDALRLAGLEPDNAAGWLDFEVGRLRDGAARAALQGDAITEFFYKQVLMCLLAHQCGAWAPQQPSQQPAEKQQLLQPQAATLFGIDEQQQQDCGADTLQQQASSGSSDPGVGTPPVLAGTPQKCASNSSSMHSDESEAVAAAERQQQARLAGRLQQLMSAWDGGRSGGSSAQVSPGGGPLSNGSASPLRQQALSVPESPLSEDTLSSLLGAFQLEGEDVLRGLDPADAGMVVAALQSPSELAQLAAAVLIEQRLELGDDADRAELVRLDCVSRLLHVMQSSRQPLLRATVATAFRHLARGAPMRQLLATAGTIPALSLLLQSPSSTARQAAARAVSNLVVNCEANKIEAAKFGTIHSLARMLEQPEAPLMQEAAAGALANLAANSSEAQALIASAGAIPLLVDVLRTGTAAAKQHAARAIRNLAGRDTSNKMRVAEAGGIPLLVAMMAGCGGGASGASDASRQAAASALSNIACNCEDTQKRIVVEGALQVVCDMLLPSDGCSAGCREAAAWMLSNLACSADVRAQLGKDPGLLEAVVAGLLELLRSGCDSGGAAAARAIKNLSAGHSNTNKVKIAEAGAVPLLVGLLRSPKDATRKAAASALWNLAYRNNPNRQAIVRVGAIAMLVDLLKPTNSEGCRQEAARALSNLSCNNDAGQGGQMVDAGAVPLLVDMMRTASPAGKEAAVGAISNLACIRAHQPAILGAGAAPLLLALMQPGASSGCQEAAARGFGNLVCDSLSDTLRPVAYQAIPLLVGIVAGAAPPGGGGASSSAASGGSAAGGAHLARAGTSAGARQAAARAISNLVCSDTTVQVLVAKSGAAPALVELCRSPNEDLREAAAVALWDLAYDSSLGREAIARAGAVPWLSQLLLFGGTGAKEAAAACLAELAAVGPAVQQQIRDAGAVQLLQGLQRSDVVEVAMASTEALRSLEVNSSRDTSRSTSSHPAGSSGAGAATAAAAAAAIAAVSGRPAAKGGAATAAPAAGPSGVAAGGIEAAASPAGGPTFNKLGSWGRRGSQTISLEQMPPEVATAEAAAAVATVTAAPPPPAVPRGAVSPLSPPPGLPRPPQSPTLKPPPLPPSAQSVQPHVQSVPLPTSPFAVGQMPPPAFME
ncbi:U-box domain-containing 4 [Micractinium conductrix]|uniref:U-box domain-containing 4 n=1 Tax=Micractinium conductrix TaxID=554055 RepID=A0A2P6V720_9CHLO|nr:U-box domain-containing 4 [Micractinium conductrix]|eukprot:PSC69879.1 U-box domain-containing 4 [Micractinium conductrix]